MNMRYLYIIITMGIIFSSCESSNNEVTIPIGLIERDSLIPILFEIHLSDAYLANNRLPKANLNKNAFYNSVFINSGYSREIFDSTIYFLARHPDLYSEIYDDVLNKISLFEAEIEKEKSAEATRLEKEKKEKKEFFKSEKVNALKDTVKTNYIHDSIFLERVEKAKMRFEERKQKQTINSDSL